VLQDCCLQVMLALLDMLSCSLVGWLPALAMHTAGLSMLCRGQVEVLLDQLSMVDCCCCYCVRH
jgi:hypothetical protein